MPKVTITRDELIQLQEEKPMYWGFHHPNDPDNVYLVHPYKTSLEAKARDEQERFVMVVEVEE